MSNKQAKKVEVERPSAGSRMRRYFSELKFEWQKITFPTRKELTQSTIVVFLFTLILMAVIATYDWLMSLMFNKFIIPGS
jgi:preprotein translocase SecE subunit